MKIRTRPFQMMLTAIVASLLFVTPAAHAQQADEVFSLSPGVLIDSNTGVAYLMSPTSRVKAIELYKGDVIWSSFAAVKPIALRGDRIISQVESVEPSSTLTLAALNIADGKLVSSGLIDLGANVISSIDDGKEHQFVIGPENINTQTGPIVWRYNQQRLSGPAADLAPMIEHFGALNVSEAVSISTIPSGGFSKKSGKPPYALPRVKRVVTDKPTPDKVILDLGSGLSYRLDGVAVPSTTSSTHETATASNSSLSLKAPQPDSGLFITEGVAGEEFPITRHIPGDQFGYSVDDRHIVASEFVARMEDHEPYRWSVYERGTFEVVSRFMARTSLAPFVFTKDRIIYIRQPYKRRYGGEMQSYPLALVAREVKSGQIVWTQPLRDTRYKGELPEQAR